MNKLYGFLLLLCVLSFFSCQKEKKESSQAYLNRADSALVINNTELAKKIVDSIHVQYPRDIAARKEAIVKKYQIELQEQKRNLHYYDSVGQVKKNLLDSLKHNFVVENDSLYRQQVIFEHKLQVKAFPNTRIRVDVNENGELSLSSVYGGKTPIHHTVLKIDNADVFVETDEIDPSNKSIHTFRDEEMYWEVVNYTKKNAEQMLLFVEQFSQEPLKVYLKGKKEYSYTLQKEDKAILIETWHFSLLLKDVYTSDKQKQIAQSKIALLQQKIQKN